MAATARSGLSLDGKALRKLEDGAEGCLGGQPEKGMAGEFGGDGERRGEAAEEARELARGVEGGGVFAAHGLDGGALRGEW